jgi:hypothetical protein
MARRRPHSKNNGQLIYGFASQEEQFSAQLAKSQLEVRGVSDSGPPSMAKSIINQLNAADDIYRHAFESDPAQLNTLGGVYHSKLRLVPDTILKRIAIQDSLVSTIVRARQEQVATFGRPRPSRFDVGFVIEAKPGATSDKNKASKKALKDRIDRAVDLLATCGHTEGLDEDHQKTLSEWLSISVRSAVVVGRIATEIVYTDDPAAPDGKKFHHFVATDAGTIYRASNDRTGLDAIRRQAVSLLSQVAGEKLQPEHQQPEHYAWVQVMEGKATQAFPAEEMKVYNFYPVPDVELDGYPVTPIDTVISSITTHINITTHNKLYFQSGRATRGMLLINSDDATPQSVNNIKQHFNASINNVNNSWRMPVFACGSDDSITWTPIDTGASRDMEFQYLTDMNAREIMSAFMMSPDELPGWTYLSRGTNNQALSEGNNEYKLEAARDLGIRPILAKFEDFINLHLLPLIDADLAKEARVRLVGLDADNPEKEAVRTQQDMGIWMSYDDVLERVEKEPVGKEWGGTIPLNPAYQAVLYKHKTVGEIEEYWMGIEGASKDPQKAYRADPFFFQWQQILDQRNAQAQATQQAAQGGPGGGAPPPGGGGGNQPPPGGGGGEDSSGGSDQPPAQTEKQKTEASESASASGAMDKAIDEAFEIFAKNEDNLPAEQRRLLAQRRKQIEYFSHGLKEDARDAIDEILAIATKHLPSN